MSESKQVKRKRKAATNAIREIKKEQKSTNKIIPTAPFQRLVQEIAQNYKGDLRIKAEAYCALQDASEAHVIELFQKSNKCAIHENRETIQPKDLRLAMEI
jgi:histone H3